MELGLVGCVTVVTGGASNIGRAISHELGAAGAVVAILDRDEAMAKRTAGEIADAGGRAVTYAVDLTHHDATQAAVKSVEADLGPVAVLVNNVGWNGKAGFFLDLPPERWEQAYRLNLEPTMNATRATLPAMVERRHGSIVSISSDAGFGEVRMGDYGPIKAGVMAFSRTIAKEYGRYGIRSNVVCPGLVIPADGAIGEGSLWQGDVGFGDKEIGDMEKAIPLRRRPEAGDVGAAVAFLASPAKAGMLTGQVLSVSGGFAMPR
ncbi:MAG: SDR family NAD(P)-dependent oxidoreductase [Ilumatobacteraceae bacterium]